MTAVERPESPTLPAARLLSPMVTPFDEDLEVDLECASRLARMLVDQGADGVVLAGVTGEGPTLTDDETIALVRAVRATVPEATVVAAVGTNDTRATIEVAKRMAEAGAHALACPTPWYSLPSRDAVHVHFELTGRLARVPVIVHDAPARTGVHLSAASAIVCAGFPGIAGVWMASGQFEALGLLAAASAADPTRSPRVWVGDEFFLYPALAAGAGGLISVTAHVATRAVRALLDAHDAGDGKAAMALQRRLFALTRALEPAGTDPAPLKAVLRLMGWPVGLHRPPLTPPPPVRLQALIETLDEAGDLVSGARAEGRRPPGREARPVSSA